MCGLCCCCNCDGAATSLIAVVVVVVVARSLLSDYNCYCCGKRILVVVTFQLLMYFGSEANRVPSRASGRRVSHAGTKTL